MTTAYASDPTVNHHSHHCPECGVAPWTRHDMACTVTGKESAQRALARRESDRRAEKRRRMAALQVAA